MPATEPYELIYTRGSYPDDVRGECLHTTRHAQHPMWTVSQHQAISEAETHLRWADKCCRTCLPRGLPA